MSGVEIAVILSRIRYNAVSDVACLMAMLDVRRLIFARFVSWRVFGVGGLLKRSLFWFAGEDPACRAPEGASAAVLLRGQSSEREKDQKQGVSGNTLVIVNLIAAFCFILYYTAHHSAYTHTHTHH